MNTHRYGPAFMASAVLLCIFLGGCGAGQKKFDEAESRIKELESKGVPDSLLSASKVFLYNARAAKKANNLKQLRRSVDSMFIYIRQAEQWYGESIERLKPEVDSLRKSIDLRKKQLSGLHLMEADSVFAIIDSLAARHWIVQAKDKCVELDRLLALLIEQELRALKLRPKVIGSWIGTRAPERKGLTAVETRTFVFEKDGKHHSTEQMKGQSSDHLKEDWKFLSWGTWDLKGDTVLMFIEREKCERQTYWNYMRKDGKMQWIKNEKPTYDSTITNGSKDRYFTYDYMVDFLKKK